MSKFIEELLIKKFKDSEIKKIESGASLREYYRINSNGKSFILMNSSKEPLQFKKYLKIHKILSNIKISIPKIYEVDEKIKTILLEDYGILRFDKILDKYDLKNLLTIAIDSLIQIKNDITFDQSYKLPIYNYNIFKAELSEFVDYYYPFCQKKILSDEFKDAFFYTWKTHFDLLEHNFTSLVHKDYNFNNLIYIPKLKKNYKCGIIDFQDSYWGEDCWDLFSLLEDSRILFNDQYNEFFINYYCLKTNQSNMIKLFKEKYHFFNCSRQTRLLGRWVKLSKTFNQNCYLDYIKVTNKRLLNSLQKPYMKKLSLLYNQLLS